MYSRLIYNRIDNKYTISRKLRGLFTNTYNKLHVCQPILGFSFAIFERFYVPWERGKVPRDILVGLRKIALSFCSYDQDTNFMQFPRVFILSTGWLCPRPCQRERERRSSKRYSSRCGWSPYLFCCYDQDTNDKAFKSLRYTLLSQNHLLIYFIGF